MSAVATVPATPATVAAVGWGAPLGVLLNTPAAEAADGAVAGGATRRELFFRGEMVQDGRPRVELRGEGVDDVAAHVVSSLTGASVLVFP